jgi:hypothetical protein
MNKQLVLLDKDSQNSNNDLKLVSESERLQNSQIRTEIEKPEVQIIPFQRSNRRHSGKMQTIHEPTTLKKEEEVEKAIPQKPTKMNISRNIIKRIVDSNYFIIYMTFLTLIALFSNDIQVAWLSSYVDNAFDILQTILLFFFTLEIVLTSLIYFEYIGSFFFWLDVVATLSLIQDISFIFNPILNAGDTSTGVDNQKVNLVFLKVSSASRITRILRIIRIIRLIRIVKLYKNALLARANMENEKKEKQKEDERKKQEEQNNSQNSNSQSNSRRVSDLNPQMMASAPSSSII